MKININCPNCNGTGLYIGFAERDGAAVICYKCKGTGKKEYEYTPFNGRNIKSGVTRVFSKNQGYILKGSGSIDYELDDNTKLHIEFDKVGVSHNEWLHGKQPKLIRGLGCPLSSDQGACHDIEGFTNECNKLNGDLVYHIPNCTLYNQCDSCWDRFENHE